MTWKLTDLKVFHVTDTATLNNTSATTAEIDAKGYRTCVIACRFGAITAGASLSAFKVQHSDTAGSGHADMLDAGASAVTDTSDDTVHYFYIDLRGKKRYLDVVMTAAGAANLVVKSVVAVLSTGEVAPPVDPSNVAGGRGGSYYA